MFGEPLRARRNQEVRMEDGRPDWGFWTLVIAIMELVLTASTRR
ncbi:hypothetical protein [Streptomyces sp. NPDC059881]